MAFTEGRYGITFGYSVGDNGWAGSYNFIAGVVGTLLHPVLQDETLKDPPSSPTDGQCWYVASGGTGAWQGHDGTIATWQNSAWAFYPAIIGMRAYIVTHAAFYFLKSDGWHTEVTSSIGGTAFTNTYLEIAFTGGNQNITSRFDRVSFVNDPSSDAGGHWDKSNNWYHVTDPGVYFVAAFLRVQDQAPKGANVAIGVLLSEGDGPFVEWGSVQNVDNTRRKTFTYARLGRFAAGDNIRFVSYSEGGDVQVIQASMEIIRIA